MSKQSEIIGVMVGSFQPQIQIWWATTNRDLPGT